MLIILILIIIILVVLCLKLKYGFWCGQPVFHCYDIHYMIFPPGIINNFPPVKNRYTNFKEINTVIFSELSELQVTRFINFIKYNYLKNGDNIFWPEKENILPYFKGHNSQPFFSFYSTDVLINDVNNKNVISDKKIISVMTSRPFHVLIPSKSKTAKDTSFDVYYVDYLCVDKEFRKKGIAQQIIQTHEYNQRHINTNICVSLFKREDELTGIMPLCVYKTYGYSVDKWRKPETLHSQYSIIEVTSQNMWIVVDFLKQNTGSFDIIINPEIANLLFLVETGNMYIYSILNDNNIKCLYFFKKTCTSVEKNKEVLTCIASITNNELSDDLFIQGFKIAFWQIAEKHNYGFAAIENISHNYKLILNINIKTKPLVVSPTAYFFYNYGCNPFKPERVLILD